MNIPIFDSLCHPTLNGLWTKNKKGLSFDEFQMQISNKLVFGAVACGLPSIGDYNHLDFYINVSKINTEKIVIPVAALTKTNNIFDELQIIKDIGYNAVKIHCRYLNKECERYFLAEIFSCCYKLGLVIFLCTYNYTSISNKLSPPTYVEIIEALKVEGRCKIVFVHGGVHDLMHFYELVRHNEHFLIDLSYTICKYHNTSLGLDIKHIMTNLDQRLVVGSDSPEFDLQQLSSITNEFSSHISKEKKVNIFYRNLEKYFYNYLNK